MNKTSPMQSKPLVDVTCKLGTKGCYEDGRCHALGSCENKIVTNADRIRAMSDEELAERIGNNSISTLCDIVCNGNCAAFPTFQKTSCQVCKEIVLKWLQTPAKEDA